VTGLIKAELPNELGGTDDEDENENEDDLKT
jgi:hypothetical protein